MNNLHPTDQAPAAEMAEQDTRGARDESRDETREETGRSRRIPLGSPELKLAAEKRPGYVRRWMNDDGNRIQQAENAGYNHVEEKAKNGKKGKSKRQVGTKETGHPLIAYLMEIKQEFYDEDQALKQRPLDEIEAAITGGTPQGAEPGDANQFYTPAEGSSITRK